MEGLSLMYPAWMVIICLAAGLIYGTLHYYKSRQFSDKGPWLTRLLFILRSLAVTLIALLLLAPLLKYFVSTEEDPVWVIAADNSASLSMVQDSLELKDLMNNLADAGSDYRLDREFILFGEEVRDGDVSEMDFSDRSTDISSLLEYINNTYDGRNLAGVLIATDGIVNRGGNPIYTPIRHSAPMHFVALGDTTVRKDLLVRRVLHNRIAYLGEKFSFQVDISAVMAAGSSSQLQVFEIGSGGERNMIHSEEINIDQADFFQTFEVITEANSPGLKRYRVVLTPIEGELSTENNTRDFFVDVLDNKQEILILGATPHPDLGTIKSLLEGYKNYEVSLYTTNNWSGDFDDYDLVILHQLPSTVRNSQQITRAAIESGKPLFFILGSKSNIVQFNRNQDLVEISGGRGRTNDAIPLVNSQFNPFSFDSELYSRFRSFVPLSSPFGQYEYSPAANVLLYQRIGQVDTDMPLLAVGEINNRRIGVLTGEGLWRWRLYEFSSFGNTDATSDIIQKTIQYLSIVEDDRRLRVFTDDNLFDENEPVIFEAEYYNASFQRINEFDLKLTITDDQDNSFDYVFDRRDDHYLLSTGPFQPGEYRYNAQLETGMEVFTAEGAFTVRPIELEAINLSANHSLLRILASSQNGQLIYPDQLEGLNDLIFEGRDFRPVVHNSLRTNLVLNLFWICIALMLFLFGEWFLRRFYGSY